MPSRAKPKTASASEPFEINGTVVPPGERRRIEIRVARLPTETWISLPVEVVHGRRPGPRLWLSAAVHGDEVNGIEIIRRVLASVDPATTRGTLVAVPIVNVFGFVSQSRYLPDRRDLNRSFPGSPHGSLAARLAHLLMREVVRKCTHGIDLHTGSAHRANLPQIRADLDDPETRRCAETFDVPVIMHAQVRDGSLRQAAARLGVTCLLYEGGEALRFNDEAIRAGMRGVLRTMSALGMRQAKLSAPRHRTAVLRESRWLRAPRGGILHLDTQLGANVERGRILGNVSDPYATRSLALRAPFDGVVIGISKNPLANQGDAVVHLGRADPPLQV